MSLGTSHSEAEREDNKEDGGDEGKEIEERGGKFASYLIKFYFILIVIIHITCPIEDCCFELINTAISSWN